MTMDSMAKNGSHPRNCNSVHRYIPLGLASLAEDAPGWHSTDVIVVVNSDDKTADTTTSMVSGPICWKCKGSGKHHKYTLEQICAMKKSTNPKTQARLIKLGGDANGGCTVCTGVGRLPTKKREREALFQPGEITSLRKSRNGWEVFGPLPYAMAWASTTTIENNKPHGNTLAPITKPTSTDTDILTKAVQLVQLVQLTGNAVTIRPCEHFPSYTNNRVLSTLSTTKQTTIPNWIPRTGEQLCNLVGRWRILQLVGSHRWTTDDLVTACEAARQVQAHQLLRRTEQQTNDCCYRYLDLGCGNGSVLSMTMWKLCQLLAASSTESPSLFCVGVEARKEAVELARRSLSFNVGYCQDDDTNDVLSLQQPTEQQRRLAQQENVCPICVKVIHGDFRELEPLLRQEKTTNQSLCGTFDLVTGTPPYFRVDFYTTCAISEVTTVSSSTVVDNNATVVEKAIINQGGMPTCRQSAPARCEFRGGIEAYCAAASLALKDDGLFVVCENWENAARVHAGAKASGLVITSIQTVKGNVWKENPLFAVYTMRKCTTIGTLGFSASTESTTSCNKSPLIVRDDKGKWTLQYAKDVLEWMSIPAIHETNAKNRQF